MARGVTSSDKQLCQAVPLILHHKRSLKVARWPCVYSISFFVSVPKQELAGYSLVMAKIITLVVSIMLACLISHSGARPSISSQTTQANEPRTLLGKPYRRLWGLPPSSPQSRWNLVAAENDASRTRHLQHQDQIGRSSEQTASQPFPRIPLPFLNTSKRTHANSGLDRPMRLSKSSDQDGMIPVVPEQVPDIAKPGVGARRGVSLRQRSSRLYDRGAWTSRLPEEY
ncbi:hypothetical protein BS17DRAFT_213053 [Gyrodon lividus]|nr:hypothetical protein BS17DRAFT_213053 [Gyrodon lividus]